MKSRISFFNGTALRKDITRFTPVWVLYLIGGLLVGLSAITGYSDGKGYAAYSLARSLQPMSIVNLAYALLCAELLFGDLFNSKLCNALHALPLRRESWFMTHTIAGLAFSIVPNLILSLCFVPFLEGMWYISALWFLGVTLEYLFFFGLAALSAVCTGNRFGMAAVYAIINFLSMIAGWFVSTFYEPLLNGLHMRYEGFSLFSPSVWIGGEIRPLVNFEIESFAETVTSYYGSYVEYSYVYTYEGLSDGWWYLAVLAAVGLAFLGLGVVLYRRRKLESAGDLIAFKPMAPVFSVLVTLCVGAVFQLIDGGTIGSGSYIFLIVGLVVGCFGCEMLLQRTVKVFKKWTFIKLAAVGGVLLLSIGITALDPLGITRWCPDPAQVESIVLSESYYYDPEYMTGLTIDNPALIKELVEIHQQILNEGEVERVGYGYIEIVENEYSSPIHLTYKLTDGREVERRYYYRSTGAAAEKLTKFFGSPEYVLGYENWEEFLAGIEYAYAASVGDGDGEQIFGEDAISLAEAVKADCENGNMIQSRNANVLFWVNFECEEYGVGLSIYEDSENTLKWIEDHDISREGEEVKEEVFYYG